MGCVGVVWIGVFYDGDGIGASNPGVKNELFYFELQGFFYFQKVVKLGSFVKKKNAHYINNF